MNTAGITLSYLELIVLAVAPGVVGGLVGLAGGVLGPWWLQDQKEMAEKKKRRAEKFEEFVSALFEHKYWLDTIEDRVVYGANKQEGISPFAKAEAICAVYFPAFRDRLDQLDRDSLEYHAWMHRASKKRAAGEKGYVDDIATVYEPYVKSLRGLLREMRDFAHREFQ